VPASPPPVTVAPHAAAELDADTITRRADLRRRAAGLSTPPAPIVPAAALDDPDDFQGAADLAAELERALGQAAEANEQLRRDLGVALDDLARATADSKRQQERADRIEAEARERTALLQDLTRELELLEGERDSALTQASDAVLQIEELREKMVVGERRVQELERALTDAHARSRRIEEQVQVQSLQRAALRTELETIRRERDEMIGRVAELETLREELARSRHEMEQVHASLSEAKQRAQRIRTR
jgi:chromosome segregation ATPase